MSRNQQSQLTHTCIPGLREIENTPESSVKHTPVHQQQFDNIPVSSVKPINGKISFSSAANSVIDKSTYDAYLQMGVPKIAIESVHHSVYRDEQSDSNITPNATTHRTCTPPNDAPPPITVPTQLVLKTDTGTFSAVTSTPTIKVNFPPAWPSQPAFQASAANTANHKARNISGDAAWPPGRPPSSGTAATNRPVIFVESDADEVTDLAQAAWLRPRQPVKPEELAATLSELLSLAKFPTAKPTHSNRPESPNPQPCLSAAQLFVPVSIDLAQFPDPEAWVTNCEHHHAPAAADRPKSLSNTTANRQGKLTQVHGPRRAGIQLNTENTDSLTCGQDNARRTLGSMACMLQGSVLNRPDGHSSPPLTPPHHPPPSPPPPPLIVVVDARPSSSRGAYNQAAQCRQQTAGSTNTFVIKVRGNAQGRAECERKLDGEDDCAISTKPSETARSWTSPSLRPDGINLGRHQRTLALAACAASGQNMDAAHADIMQALQVSLPTPIPHNEGVWEMAEETNAIAHPGAGGTRELFLLSGSQRLRGKLSNGIGFKRWTVTVGLTLGEHGIMKAQVIGGIRSTLTDAIKHPEKGWVGHRWFVEIVRIVSETAEKLSGTETEEFANDVADKTACILLEGTEKQRNTLSEETVVQDDIDMERMLACLLPLLVSGSTPRAECHRPEDLRVLQAFPPLAWPEEGGVDNARGEAGSGPPLHSRSSLRATEDLSVLRVRKTPPAPIPSATSRPEGRKVDSTAAPPHPGAPRPRTDWTLRDFLPVPPLSDKSLTPDPIAWRKAAVAHSESTRRRSQLQSIQSREAEKGQQHRRRNQTRPQLRHQPEPTIPLTQSQQPTPTQPTTRLPRLESLASACGNPRDSKPRIFHRFIDFGFDKHYTHPAVVYFNKSC